MRQERSREGQRGAEERRKKPIEIEAVTAFYLSAWEEDKYIVAQANVELDEKGRIVHELVNARQAGNFVLKHRDEVDYIDVSPKQLVSVAASLIPFLENDDANRALMGSNMQRQAVPLLRAEAPLGRHRHGTRHGARFRRGGDLASATASWIRSTPSASSCASKATHHPTAAFARSGRGHLPADQVQALEPEHLHQPEADRAGGPARREGPGLADGPCTEKGELALGRNVLVAFMPWRGYNFEDAILVTEKLVKEDYYTSIHIEEFEIEARDTKLGPEEITRDIPNISEIIPAQPGRKRHHPHRRDGQAGRHPGGQGDAEGRNPADAGRETAARDLRRKGRRR